MTRVDQLRVGDRVRLPGATVPLVVEEVDPYHEYLDRPITLVVAGGMQWKLWPGFEVDVVAEEPWRRGPPLEADPALENIEEGTRG